MRRLIWLWPALAGNSSPGRLGYDAQAVAVSARLDGQAAREGHGQDTLPGYPGPHLHSTLSAQP